MATLKDISRHLGLSVTQVSRALNDHADVSRETKARVRQAARELGYSPNLTARKLRLGRSGLVAMIVPARSETVEIEILMETVMGLSTEFSRRGMQFVLHVLSDGEDAADAHVTLIRAGSVDGIVLTDPRCDDPRLAVLTASDMPFIVHGRDRVEAAYPFVDIDHRALGHTLAAHLAGLGCRRVALVDGPADRPYARLRREGVAAALAAQGLQVDPALTLSGPMTETQGREVAAALRADGADGVVAGNMMLAAGLRDVLGPVPIAAHDDSLLHFPPDRIGPPLARTVAPLSDAWVPLCDGLAAAIDRQGKNAGILLDIDFRTL